MHSLLDDLDHPRCRTGRRGTQTASQGRQNIHPPGEVDRPEMVKFIVSDPASLPGIVVDETAAELVGEWQYSTHTPPYVGLGYLHDMKAGKGTKSVTFTPDLPKAGWYEVRLAHCYNVRRATNTPVTIHHADGDTTVRINQQQEPPHGHLFRTLGTFRFEAGRKGWVRVSNEGTEATKWSLPMRCSFCRWQSSLVAVQQETTKKPESRDSGFVIDWGDS
jgi:hypothetical protein